MMNGKLKPTSARYLDGIIMMSTSRWMRSERSPRSMCETGITKLTAA